MCGFSLRSLAACFLALFFSAAATQSLHGEESATSPPSATSTSGEAPSPTASWESFDRLLTMLESEAEASRTESIALLSQLLASQIEASALRHSLGLSAQSLSDFERSMESERIAAAKALEASLSEVAVQRRRAERWKIGALAAGALAAAGWGVAVFQAVF